ncbi:MAG: filamentous hemagglutinin N-terminal domain-containing protein, partial [Maritimibacter sp.]
MNKFYRHIWSSHLGGVVVVPEGMRGGGRKKSSRTGRATQRNASRGAQAIARWSVVTLMVIGAGPALAGELPTGGAVTSGSATIASTGSDMTITQSSDQMIATWSDFSIGAGNSVTFVQPDASSVALNRVTGGSTTQILGSLNANGQVFLLNPNGIAIGASGQVQAGAFVASTLSLSDSDFLAGNYQFSGSTGAISNAGTLNGNVIALIAPTVSNSGTITGDTALAAGSDVTLDFAGDGLISVDMGASDVAALVENSGAITADGGTAILTARGASQALAGVVNNTGTVRARTMARQGGRILLLAGMEHGTVNAGGTLDASAPNGGDGGFVETSAAHVKIADTVQITTNSASGENGTWLIDPVDFTIAASGGDMTGATLSSSLGSGNVTIQSTSGGSGTAGDVNVNDTVSWSANTLTLNAQADINITTEMNASGTAGLALEYGQANLASGNTASYNISAPVNLASTGSFSTKRGSDGSTVSYTIITSLGAEGSTTTADLQGINGLLYDNYVLGADIDASATSGWTNGFVPLGTNGAGSIRNSFNGFSGIFDGLGHTISDLSVDIGTKTYGGMFGYASEGIIRNVGLEGGSIAGGSYLGGLIGYDRGADIYNSYSSADVTGTGQYTGGLVGYLKQADLVDSYA